MVRLSSWLLLLLFSCSLCSFASASRARARFTCSYCVVRARPCCILPFALGPTSTRQIDLISPKTSLFLSFYIAPWSFILSLSHYFCFLLYLLPRVFTFYLSHYLSLTRAPWGGPHPPSHARATRLVREVRKKEAGAAYIERAPALALRVRDETGPSSARGGGGGGGTGDASGGVSGG